jgi:two-component system sensor histidine kinase HydH
MLVALAEARARAETLSRRLVDHQRLEHAILDGVDVGIVTANAAEEVTFVNGTAAAILQVDRSGGMRVDELLGLSAGPAELLGGHGKRVLSYVYRREDGTEVELEVSVSRSERGQRGRGDDFFVIFRDVSDEKRRQAERARFERLAAMGTMVAGFAHEVRNPVAALRSIAEELGEELRDAGVDVPHVRFMLQMVDRIERLVRTSLQFGRPAAPKRAPQRPWVIASIALGELVQRTRALGGEIAIDAESDLLDVNVDERQIAQALVVLLNNALDATGTATRVALRVRPDRSGDARAIRFEVVDQGPGIPPAIVGRIFDPFFTTKATGTGLGLSIAQQLVSENCGRIEVSSPPGGPTTFAVVVPCAVRTGSAGG